MKLRFLTTCLLLTAVLLGIAACEKKGPAEKLGEKIDNAAESTSDKIDSVAEDAADKLESAKDAVKDKAEEAHDKN
jgi:predicted small lipoprotein YifL